jgi:pyruvate, water dikinase
MDSEAAVEYIRPLQRLSRADEPHFGGKSANLGELLAAEIPVPPGFAIATAAYEAFVHDAGLHDRIESALSGVTPGDVDAIGRASHSISEAMRFAPVPEAVRVEIEQHYAQIGQAAGEDSPPVAVRSSAVGEDSQDATFAGQQETYLWVRGAEHVCDAVRDCWVSLYSPPAISYRLRLAERDLTDAPPPPGPPPAMGVAVQLMVDAEVSGVMFTCNPVSGDPSMVAINASWGLGLAVVGGEVTPDDFLVSKVTREVVREHVHAKQVQYVPDAGGSGAVRVNVPDERRDARCLDQPALERLVEVARRVERYFGSHQDIEWAIAREDPEALFVVQARPVTAIPKKREQVKAESALSLIMSTFGARTPPE